jgi:TP901 family phage tail tape measure protein
MAGRFKVEAVFKGIDKLSAPIRRMENRVKKFARSSKRAIRSVNRAFTTMNAKIKSGAMVGAVAIAGLGVIIKDLIMTSADFGRAIGQASVKFPENIKRGTKAFKELEDVAKEVGRTTEFTATEAGRGLNFLAKAGYTAGFSMKALAPIVDFATASELEFATASDIASDAMGAFNMNAKDEAQKMKNLNRIMDVMALTSIRSNTSVEELFETMKKGAPVAEASGASIETYSAIMAVLAGAGIKGSIAGTSAKRLFLALTGIGGKAPAVMKKLGILTADPKTGKIRDQFDILDDLFKKISTFGQKKRLSVIEQLFGKIPLASANILLRDSTKQLRALRKEFEGGTGSSKRMATAIRDDLKGSIDSLFSAIEGVKLQGVEGAGLKGVVDSLTAWVRVNKDDLAGGIGTSLENIKKLSIFLWNNADKIFYFASAYTALSIASGLATSAMTLFNIAMNANPIVLAITLITSAILGLIWAVKEMGGVKPAFMKTFGAGLLNYASGITGMDLREGAPLHGASRGYTPKYSPDTAGNQGVTFDFKNMPPWVDVRGDDGVELDTGNSGGIY